MTSQEAKSYAVLGVLFRPDGGSVTLADHEALWELFTSFASERGLQFTGRVAPVDMNDLTPEKLAALLHPDLSHHDPL
ncbi:hypothetical protein [Deinococcus pimensis]|uniref:hypothetical protein n=1 Tax=Deinococcus pimensis TaxID=309888 RepID=UPI0004819708|nr:hypothetical protein [Deinococcus pimensis]